MAEAGLHNVSFIQSDAREITESKPLDAAVGRFSLMWVSDPVSVLRSLSRLVRPGGVVAFQEPNWLPVLALLKPLPLWFAAASLIHKTFQESGGKSGARTRSVQRFSGSGTARTNHASRDTDGKASRHGAMVFRHSQQFVAANSEV